MQKSSPKYRINYLRCKQAQHSDEKTNLICLSQECQQNSLICSLCQEEKHKGHQTKPLKHFLSGLEKRYAEQKNNTVNDELEELQQGRTFLLSKIREAVESLAQRFLELEGEVIQKYELIKSQILEREAKRNRFSSFYESMALQGKGDPNFQIQNYLHFEPLERFNLSGQLDTFIESSNNTLKIIRETLITRRKDSTFVEEKNKIVKQIDLPVGDQFVTTGSIIRNGNIFTQSSPNSKQTLGYLNVFLKNWTGKLRIKITKLQPNSKFAVGVATVTDITTSKTIQELRKKPFVFYLDNTGAVQSQEYNHITTLKVNDVIDVFVKKNNCKIVYKGSICCHHLKNKETTVVYFSLEGACEVEMIYPFFKS